MAKKRNTQPIPKLSQFVVDGKPTEFCWEYITTLAKVVASKYFAKYFAKFCRAAKSRKSTNSTNARNSASSTSSAMFYLEKRE